MTENVPEYNLNIFAEYEIVNNSKKGLYANIIGRDDTLDKIEDIITGKYNNNVVIVGKRGIGKTALINGLASRIANKTCKRSLYDKEIVKLDLLKLFDTNDVGISIRSLFSDMIIDKNNICIIDNFHLLKDVQYRCSVNNYTIINMLSKYFNRCDIPFIVLLEDRYYDQMFSDNLKFYFNKIEIEELSDNIIKDILLDKQETLEYAFKVKYDDIFDNVIKYAHRYKNDNSVINTTFDIISKVSSKMFVIQDKYKNKLLDLNNKKQIAIDNLKYDVADKISKKENKILSEIDKEQKNIIITKEELKRVISEEYSDKNIITSIDDIDLKVVSKNIKNRLFGQDESIDSVIQHIQRYVIGFNDTDRPIASFMFVGKSGCGKTELSKLLAKELFNDKSNFLKLDMSEYSSSVDVSKLIGIAPGYVGYDTGGFLTNFVREHPNSLILFDEIEKACKDVRNILLQILDYGYLMDSHYNKVDFRNTIIIMTSNAGVKELDKISDRNLGFGNLDKKPSSSKVEESYKKSLKSMLSPELYNRIDKVCIFNDIEPNNINDILNKYVDDINERIKKKGYDITLDNTFVDYICNYNFDLSLGVREILRILNEKILDGVINYVYENNKKNITIKYLNNKILYN